MKSRCWKRCASVLPDSEVLEVFPYSVQNRALTGQRFFAWFWRFALKLKLSRVAFAGFIINLRNAFQVAVSADRRYGPIYNQGMAETLHSALRGHGYSVGSGVPVTIVGYSGGGQVAVGAAAYLKEIIHAPVTVVSLGGIMASDEGLLASGKPLPLGRSPRPRAAFGAAVFSGPLAGSALLRLEPGEGQGHHPNRRHGAGRPHGQGRLLGRRGDAAGRAQSFRGDGGDD